MPRKTKIPDAEISICKRLRLYRQRCGFPRRIFARQAGIDTAVLIRIELGRVPLKYGTACSLVRAFTINPHWLATGEGSLSSSILLQSPEDIGVDGSELFSTVYRHKIHDSVKKKILDIERDPSQKYGTLEIAGDPWSRVFAEEFLRKELAEWFVIVPDARLADLVNAIRFAAIPIADGDWDTRARIDDSETVVARRAAMELERRRLEGRRALLAANKSKPQGLTDTSLKRNSGAVTIPTLQTLREELLAMTSPKGSKAALAKLLGVPQARVSEWLSGRKEPGGETTLRLLSWVKAEEAKQENPDRALTRPGKKTQVRKSTTYEKANSSPQKR